MYIHTYIYTYSYIYIYIIWDQVIFANPVKALSEEELEGAFPAQSTLRVRGNEVLFHCLVSFYFCLSLYVACARQRSSFFFCLSLYFAGAQE